MLLYFWLTHQARNEMMSKRLGTSILSVFLYGIIAIGTASGQNYAGYWLGVTYPSDPNNAIFNYFGNFTQSGATIGGTAQTANPKVAFGGLAYVKGSVTATTVKFKESDSKGTLDTPLTCYWSLDLKYDPVEESLKGTYSNIQNPPYCDEPGGGKVELYRIVLKSGNKYCKGQAVNLTVTGKNIRWYDSANKGRMVAQGNNFSPKISQTTTFYITQTLYNTESPAIPIKVEIVDVAIVDAKATPPGCGKTNGTIAIAASGSTGLQYSIDGGTTFQNSPQFSGLAVNTYKVKVKDDAGCAAEREVELKAATAPTISDIKAENPTCGQTNGQLTVAATGSGALQYSIDGTNYQASNVFGKLSGGGFTVSVKDDNNCAATKKASLTQPNASKIATATSTPTTCGEEDGGITVTTAATNAQYSIDGSKFQPGADFRNLPAGNYTVTMKDAAGCTDTKAVTVAASIALKITNVEAKPASCGQKDGSFAVTASGGTGFQYSADGGTTFQASPQFAGLADNTYKMQVKNAAGCITEREVELKGPAAPTITDVKTQNPTCGEINGQLTVAATGTGTLQYSIDGTNYQASNVFGKLNGGDITVSIKDDKGCVANKKASLAKSSAVKITAAQATPTTCGEANGGIAMTTVALDVQYSADGTNFQPSATFKNMKAGTYAVIMRDAFGCTDTRTVTVAGSEAPALSDVLVSPVSCGVADGTISVQATARTAVQYALNGGNYGNRNSFNNLAVGEYEVAVRDAGNCVVLRKVTVRSDCANTIFVPTSFSPNGDGQNDQLTVHFPFPSLQFSSVRVYNRWGNAVHGGQNLTLSSGDAIWDGKLDGQAPMTENYYVLVAEVKFEDGTSHTFRKEVMVMR